QSRLVLPSFSPEASHASLGPLSQQILASCCGERRLTSAWCTRCSVVDSGLGSLTGLPLRTSSTCDPPSHRTTSTYSCGLLGGWPQPWGFFGSHCRPCVACGT